MSDPDEVSCVHPADRRVADPTPGKVRKHVVHREINPGSAPSQEVVTRSGTGPLTINVDGPAPASG